MTISIPDVDIDTMSLDELKAHAYLCATVENELRAHSIKVQSRIIEMINGGFNRQTVFIVKRNPKKIVLGAIEDEYSIEDFK